MLLCLERENIENMSKGEKQKRRKNHKTKRLNKGGQIVSEGEAKRK